MADKIVQFIMVDEWILKVSRELIIRFIILRRVNCWAARHVRDSNFTKSDYPLYNYYTENHAVRNEIYQTLHNGTWQPARLNNADDEYQ